MKVIGKFKELYKDNTLPSILNCTSNQEHNNKPQILSYLKHGEVTAASPKTAYDVISGEKIATELTMLSDGVYAWRSDIIYYFEKYNITLDSDFVSHILS